MKNKLPTEIDPISLAQKNITLEGEYHLNHFPRLKIMVKNEDLNAKFKLLFSRDEEGNSIITGKIRVGLDLTCERCNELVHFDFDLSPKLAAVISETRSRNLPEDYEPVITEGNYIALSQIIEDEILLAIPMIPKHELGECPQAL